jgi:glycine hydroxymethyltransferase
MHKYSEGNIGKRYYEGNYNVDDLEKLTIERARKVFKVPENWTANVQALSGSNANLAVYLALLNPGDKIMSMYLPDGGHLSHGWSYEPNKEKRKKQAGDLEYKGGSRKVNISSKLYEVIQYKTDPDTQLLNYNVLNELAAEHRPDLIITGGTAYPRGIDYRKMKAIAESVGALYLADIAHEAGLVAAGAVDSPVGIADVVTMTTHKTLRSGRGAIILSDRDTIKKVNRAVLPGLQGGPHNHNIAGVCVGLGEAMGENFQKYGQQVVRNAKKLAEELNKYDFELVSGGTDKHLILIDLTNKGVFGKKYARALDYAGIIANMNTMPGETRSPSDPSALRIGTPWITTRGMREDVMPKIAEWFNEVMEMIQPWAHLDFDEFEKRVAESEEIRNIAEEVRELCGEYSSFDTY